MADMYDSGLFSELGDLLGHDPTFYEESDVSSNTGGITKQSFYTSSPVHSTNMEVDTSRVPEPFSSAPYTSDATEIDSLLSHNNMLLDKLMAANGLDLLTAPVELADVDELITSESEFHSSVFETKPISDLFSQFYEPAYDEYQQAPVSPVSTLPSEPSSPVDLFSLDAVLSPEPTPAATAPTVTTPDSDINTELDELLSSLLDDGSAPSSIYEQPAYSPTDSSCSGSEFSCYGGAGSLPTVDMDDSVSSCGYSCSPAPQKVKTPKKKKSTTPYSKLPAGRKEKKKMQNKEAAIRYRQKKKSETQVLADVENQLRERNNELKSEALNLEREIMCMKELLSDVFNVHSL